MPAIIDIGSNSVRLLLGGKKTTVITRLSEGLNRTGRLDNEAMGRTLETVCGFVNSARAAGGEVFAFGTEPLRAAANAGEFIQRLQCAAGITVKVLSGNEEAELAHIGASGGKPAAVIDAGGASVEIICGAGGNIVYCKSLPIGMVRLTEGCGGDAEKIAAAIDERITGYGKVPVMPVYYGVAGSFTSLAAMHHRLAVYDPDVVHGTVLTKKILEELLNELIPMRGDAAKIVAAFPGLPPRRAEIITAGAIFAAKLPGYLVIESITVSEKDNLDGALILLGNDKLWETAT